MTKILLVGNNSALSYNTPVNSRYDLVRISDTGGVESIITAWQPEWLQYDLIHAVGRVLYADQPWIYTSDLNSERSLIETENQQLLDRVREWLAQDSCKKIVVNSNFAKKQFVRLHQSWSKFEQLLSKVEIIYPSCKKIVSTAKSWSDDKYLHLLWLGSFERDKDKNYTVASNLAQKALTAKVPLKIHFLSKPKDNGELWQLNNVICHELAEEKDILQLMAQCHFQLLTPLTDEEASKNFYRMLSGFSVGTPAITTNLELLTEFNSDRERYLLELDESDWHDRDRESQAILSDIYNNLVEQALHILQEFWQDPQRAENYQTSSEKALAQIEDYRVSDRLDYLYAKSLAIDTTPSFKHSKPLVSIVIPLYNGELYIKEAVDSILRQTYDRYEIIIVDDGSIDNSRQVLEPYLNRVRYIYQENQGVSRARNNGIRQSKGELVAFLDADDFFLLSTKLADEVDCFNNCPTLGLIHSGWSQVDSEGNKITDERCWLQVPNLNLESWISHKYVLPSAIIVRRCWLDKIGGYSTYLTHSEDVDLILRLLSLGCEAAWLEKIAVAYRQHSDNASVQTYKRAESLETVLNRFFALPNLPEAVVQKKERVIFYDLLWVAWCFYRDLDLEKMANYIQKAFEISPYLYSDTIVRCLNQFDFLNQQYVGKKIAPLFLTNSSQWRKVIRDNMAIKK